MKADVWAVVRVVDQHDSGRHVGTAVKGEMTQDGQTGQIYVGLDHLLTGRIRDDLRLV